jgi:hypothetical protein
MNAAKCTQYEHFGDELQKYFVELWRRIEEGSLPGIHTKAEACDLIGCSVRWAEAIVARAQAAGRS